MRMLLWKSIAAVLLLAAMESRAQVSAPAIVRSGLYGGSNQDSPWGLVQTDDGGFLMGGVSYSFDGQVPSKHKSKSDGLVLRTDDTGKFLWSTVFGGSDYESVYAVAASGSLVVAVGDTWSNDGDFPYSGSFTGRGTMVWLDSADGHMVRSKIVSGDLAGYNTDVKILAGKKILVCGRQINSGLGSKPAGENACVTLLDDTGRVIWERSFGGRDMGGYSYASAALQKQDGGFMVIGTTSVLTGATIPGHHGTADIVLADLDTVGNIRWIRYYGGSGGEVGKDLIQTQDGGFLLGGVASADGGDVSGAKGGSDYWVIKVDKDGKLLWQKTYGGSSEDMLLHMAGTCDNGAILQGTSTSLGGDAVNNKGIGDQLLVRIDDKGNVLWSQCYGSSWSDFFGDVAVTSDGHYALAACPGKTDQDVSGSPWGNGDFWLARFGADGLSNYCPLPEPPEPKEPSGMGLPVYSTAALKVYPNPVSNQLHIESSLPVQATLSDLQGRVLLQTSEKDMDLADLADGIYLLHCRDNQGKLLQVQKIQKTGSR